MVNCYWCGAPTLKPIRGLCAACVMEDVIQADKSRKYEEARLVQQFSGQAKFNGAGGKDWPYPSRIKSTRMLACGSRKLKVYNEWKKAFVSKVEKEQAKK